MEILQAQVPWSCSIKPCNYQVDENCCCMEHYSIQLGWRLIMLISARLCTNTSYLNDFLVQQYINNQKRHFNILLSTLFTIFSPTYFGQCSSHLQGDVLITRIKLCIFQIRISPWRWPKHVGENIVNTSDNIKVPSVGYLYIFGSDQCMEDGTY